MTHITQIRHRIVIGIPLAITCAVFLGLLVVGGNGNAADPSFADHEVSLFYVQPNKLLSAIDPAGKGFLILPLSDLRPVLPVQYVIFYKSEKIANGTLTEDVIGPGVLPTTLAAQSPSDIGMLIKGKDGYIFHLEAKEPDHLFLSCVLAASGNTASLQPFDGFLGALATSSTAVTCPEWMLETRTKIGRYLEKEQEKVLKKQLALHSSAPLPDVVAHYPRGMGEIVGLVLGTIGIIVFQRRWVLKPAVAHSRLR